MSRALAAVLLLVASFPAAAAEQELKVDSFANGGQVRAQGAYSMGEKFAIELDADPADYPLRIRSVQALFIPTYAGGDGQIAPFHLTIYTGTGTETPGTVLFDQGDDFQLTASTSSFNEIVLPTPIDLESGSIRVAFTATMDQAESSVTIGQDEGPIQQTRNFIFAGGSWNRAAALGLTGNFIIRAIADSNFGGGGSPPVVTGVSPDSATNDQSTVVTVTGSGFEVGASARIGTTALTGVTVSGTGSLSGTLRAGVAAGTYAVSVTNPDAQASSLAAAFEVLEGGGGGGSGGGGGGGGPAPTVLSIVPGVAPAGEAVSFAIFGSDLRAGARVTLGGEAATGVEVLSSTVLRGVAPGELPVGAHDVTVENSDGGADTLPGAFVVVSGGGGGLSVDRAVPSEIAYGDAAELVILGSGFTSGALVTIGGEPLTNGVLLGPAAIAGFAPRLDPGVYDVVVSYDDGRTASRAGAVEVFAGLFGGPNSLASGAGGASEDSGCGCAAAGPAGALRLGLLGLSLLGLRRRRR